MSALEPKNKKYRSTWKVWGQQMIPSKAYKNNYDQIRWGKSDLQIYREELTSPSHYLIKIRQG